MSNLGYLIESAESAGANFLRPNPGLLIIRTLPSRLSLPGPDLNTQNGLSPGLDPLAVFCDRDPPSRVMEKFQLQRCIKNLDALAHKC